MTRAHDSSERRAEQIEQKAAEWVTRIDLRDTPEEWAALDAWLSASPRHRAAFLRLSVAWQRANGLKKLAPMNGVVDEDLFAPAGERNRPSYEDVMEGRAISLDAYLPGSTKIAPAEQDTAQAVSEHLQPVSGHPAESAEPAAAEIAASDLAATEPTRTASAPRPLRVVASNDNPAVADSGWTAMRNFRGLNGSTRKEEDARRRARSHGGGGRRRWGSLLSTRAAASIAAVAVMAGIGGWYAVERTRGDVYSTGIGEFRRVALLDGSSIALNTDTKVRVRYTEKSRYVELLRGEALFEVTKNPDRPFDVEAAKTTVRAVGTAFSVRLHAEDRTERVDVVVSEGRIAINPPSKETYAAGSVSIVRKGRIQTAILPVENIIGKLAWTTGRLVFQGEQLGEVVQEMNRYNLRKLEVADPDIAGMRIGGTFQATDPAGFARALDRAFGIKSQVVTPQFGAEVIRLSSGVP